MIFLQVPFPFLSWQCLPFYVHIFFILTLADLFYHTHLYIEQRSEFIQPFIDLGNRPQVEIRFSVITYVVPLQQYVYKFSHFQISRKLGSFALALSIELAAKGQGIIRVVVVVLVVVANFLTVSFFRRFSKLIRPNYWPFELSNSLSLLFVAEFVAYPIA